LAWAKGSGAFILEDDYDAEFYYEDPPQRALQGIDPDRVIYIGTTSKTLAPALRLGWLVLPDRLVDEAARAKQLLDFCSPPLEQRALARFIAGGHYDRHIRRMSRVYRRRRDALVAAFTRHLPEVELQGTAAGLHVMAVLPASVNESMVVRQAARSGLRVLPLSRFALRRPTGPGLVLGFGRIGEQAIDGAVRALAEAIAASQRLSERPAAANRN
jgi:GntR family transcriptional regulator/MocR family aminotransferase